MLKKTVHIAVLSISLCTLSLWSMNNANTSGAKKELTPTIKAKLALFDEYITTTIQEMAQQKQQEFIQGQLSSMYILFKHHVVPSNMIQNEQYEEIQHYQQQKFALQSNQSLNQ